MTHSHLRTELCAELALEVPVDDQVQIWGYGLVMPIDDLVLLQLEQEAMLH